MEPMEPPLDPPLKLWKLLCASATCFVGSSDNWRFALFRNWSCAKFRRPSHGCPWLQSSPCIASMTALVRSFATSAKFWFLCCSLCSSLIFAVPWYLCLSFTVVHTWTFTVIYGCSRLDYFDLSSLMQCWRVLSTLRKSFIVFGTRKSKAFYMACVVPGARGRGKVLIDEGYKYHLNKRLGLLFIGSVGKEHAPRNSRAIFLT